MPLTIAGVIKNLKKAYLLHGTSCSNVKQEDFFDIVSAWLEVMPQEMSDQNFTDAMNETLRRVKFFPKPADVCEIWKEQCARVKPAPLALPKPPLSIEEELVKMRQTWVSICQIQGKDPGDKYLSTSANKAEILKLREIEHLKRLLRRPFKVGETPEEYRLQKAIALKRLAELDYKPRSSPRKTPSTSQPATYFCAEEIIDDLLKTVKDARNGNPSPATARGTNMNNSFRRI